MTGGLPAPVYRRRERTSRLTFATKFYQAIGAVPDTVLNWVAGTFILIYYNRILGVDALLVSLALAAAIIVDAVLDPLVASISDNLHSRWGRRHPLMLLGAVPLGAAFVPIFMPPAGLSQAALASWLLCFVLLTRAAMSLFFIPWAAIAAELSDDYEERTSVMSHRFAIGWTIGVAFPWVVYSVLMKGSAERPGQLDPANYPAMAICAGILMTVCGVLTTVLTLRQVPFLRQPETRDAHPAIGRTIRELLRALGNRNFALLFVIVVLSAAIGGTTANIGLYMATYFWHLGPDDLRWFALSAVGAIVAFPLVALVQRRWDKKHILLACAILSLLDGIGAVALRLGGLMPANGDPMLIVVLVTMGILGAGIAVVQGIIGASIVADILDEHELETGFRQEAMFNAALSFSGKAASGFGIVLGGMIISALALPADGAGGTIPADAARRLGIVAGLALPLLYLVPIALVSRYGITRLRHREIREALASRKAQVAASVDAADGP